MTRKLDLRTGKPVWFAYRAPAVPTKKLSGDIEADVLVIGMGISGAMMAEALTADGRKVVAIDRRGPMRGSTPATTALVQYEIDQPLSKLGKRIGREVASRAWRRSRLAVSNLSGRISQLDIACDLTPRPSLLLAGNVLDADGLRDEVESRRAAGLQAIFLDAAALKERFGISRKAAILSPDNLALDPRKLTSGLLNIAAARGARFFAPVEAEAFEDAGDRVKVSTTAGPVITASEVVIATGYELPSLSMPARHSIVSTWAIATRPQPRSVWPESAFIWEASDPYLYMRATRDGRVICGGEDEDFTDEEKRDALLEKKTRAIVAKLKALMPQLDPAPDYAWTGSFGTTSTGLPIIGKVPGRSRIHAIMGYGGNGITFSQIASEVIATRLRGGRDMDSDLFRFET